MSGDKRYLAQESQSSALSEDPGSEEEEDEEDYDGKSSDKAYVACGGSN